MVCNNDPQQHEITTDSTRHEALNVMLYFGNYLYVDDKPQRLSASNSGPVENRTRYRLIGGALEYKQQCLMQASPARYELSLALTCYPSLTVGSRRGEEWQMNRVNASA
jgi:hypothetical protein